jgi:CPA2 family monovalent cation:H+ antiporter-2
MREGRTLCSLKRSTLARCWFSSSPRGVLLPLLDRLGCGSVLGFLVVGLVIGPFGLARFVEDLPWLAYAVITNLDRAPALAELGVAFLLFMIGLELSVDRLWAIRLGLGGAQAALTSALFSG